MREYSGYQGCDDCPVGQVMYYSASAYALLTGKRLPTEVEWEFAAIGGNKSQGFDFSGSNEINDVGWYEYNMIAKNNTVEGAIERHLAYLKETIEWRKKVSPNQVYFSWKEKIKLKHEGAAMSFFKMFGGFTDKEIIRIGERGHLTEKENVRINSYYCGRKKINGKWYPDGSDCCEKWMQPVRYKQPNELGLYDMTGNVGEWCTSYSYLQDPTLLRQGNVRGIPDPNIRESQDFTSVYNTIWPGWSPPQALARLGFRCVRDK